MIAVCLVGPSSLYVHGHCKAFELVIAGCLDCAWLNHHQTPSSPTSHPFLFRRKSSNPVVISELNLQIPTAVSSKETTPSKGYKDGIVACTATLVIEK